MPQKKTQNKKIKKQKAKVQPYTRVMNPVSVGNVQRATQPQITANAKSCRIKHRELLDLIVMSAGFFARTYRINPGVGATFPWLSGQAQGWEQYKFHNLSLKFLPTCSTTEPGVLVMFVDYDPTDSPPGTVRDAMANSTATAGPVRNASTVTANPVALLGGLKKKYVETQMSNASEPRSTDSGNFFVVTENGNSQTQIGAVWIEYDVEFFYPQRATPSAFSQAIGVDASATSDTPFGLPAGGLIQTAGHLIHNVVGYYPNGTVVPGSSAEVLTLKNIVSGAKYLINAYVNTNGAAADTLLTTALSADGVLQPTEPLVQPSLTGTGAKATSFVWQTPSWLTSQTEVGVSVYDPASFFANAARLTVERLPNVALPLAYP